MRLAAGLSAIALAPLCLELDGASSAPPATQGVGCHASAPWFRLAGPRARRVVALTFDDGPGPATPAILDVLGRERVPATFFPVGQRVAGNEVLLRRVLAAGGALGNHTFHHVNISRGGLTEMRRAQAAIRSATGYAPCLFRAPRNKISPLAVAQARSLGLATVHWDVDSRDWTGATAEAIHARVVTRVRPGSVVLLHDEGRVRANTLAALPAITASLRQRGYRFVTVPQLLGFRPRRSR